MTPGPDLEIRKHSVTIAGHRTSLSLEDAFWRALKAAAREEGVSVNVLVERIDRARTGNLSSAVRVSLLRRRQAALGAAANRRIP
ncbi:MAG: ribbon-helix-helix domain-containing protein [Kiloniellaceae bacterium]